MKNWFTNLKFRYKLLIGMIFITSAALMLISQLSYSYFYKRNTNEVFKKAESSVRMAEETLSTQFTSLSMSTNHLLVKDPFPRMISDINNRNFTGYSKYFSKTTALTDSFLQNNVLINNIIICGEDSILFSPSTIGMGHDFETLFTENIWFYPHITVFPTRFNSMFKQGGVIPISYPISCNLSAKKLIYQDTPDTRKARLIVLIDTAQLRSYFNRMSNNYTYCMYLTDQYGNPLDITEEDYPDAFLPEVKERVSKNNGVSTDKELFMAAQSLNFCNLKVVHLTKKSALTGDIKELRSFFLLVWLACTIASGLLSFTLSDLLTRNLKVLEGIIGRINKKTYHKKVNFSSTDEISLLGIQLNQMYDTIQLQLKQIKEEEQKKAQAEIQMMSEQINPHFLYNTLECIHIQVLKGHAANAAGMLESLGRYLRITLSVGKTFISVEKEVEHVTSYMEIMNRHSASGIQFYSQIDPALKECKIMKSLLQPLAENAIKHGFGGSVSGLEPILPQITVSITMEEKKRIRIEVSDNGKGIDVEKASACVTDKNLESKKHFGLNNLYRRLIACYGDETNISFVSIPYLKNSVIIEIPVKTFLSV